MCFVNKCKQKKKEKKKEGHPFDVKSDWNPMVQQSAALKRG